MSDNKDGVDVKAACYAAVRGERVPERLDDEFVRASLIRGIRLHYTFAITEEVTKLSNEVPSFARARNARMIMSNVLPQHMTEEQQPYCIWYPDFATEDTYRALVQHYPQMRYTVGRACAAAGYDALYSELDLLPEVSIAEEARESESEGEGARRIYESIMSRPVRYAVMDDFTRGIETENPRSPAFLNGDTEVRWRLEPRDNTIPWRPDSRLPCIEEDMHTNDKQVRLREDRLYLNHDEIRLLYEPLPQDLPTVRKNLLIHMAAFDGNIDRYARLAGPASEMNQRELQCVIRGIYHHTMYARWWGNEISQNTPRIQAIAKIKCRYVSHLDKIKMAISARRIMMNDPREFYYDGWPSDAPKPYFIWWPLRPDPAMLSMLAEKVPSMVEQAAVAAIFCDYESDFKHLCPTPNGRLWVAASKSKNSFYREHIQKKAAEKNIEVETLERHICNVDPDPELFCMEFNQEPTNIFNFPPKIEQYDFIGSRYGPYDEGKGPDSVELEFNIWAGLAGA